MAGTLGALAMLAFAAMATMAGPAASAAPSPTEATAGSVVVAVDLSGTVDRRIDRGVLVRSGQASAAPMVAVYVGLSLVGATLALITARRRLLAVKATELVTGVVVGRRARAEFWNAGLRHDPGVRVGPETFPPRTPSRSGVAMLVGSGDGVMIAEHGPRPGRGT